MASATSPSSLLGTVKELLELTDFSSTTWMAAGAALFVGLQSCLPDGQGKLLPILYLGFLLVKKIIDMLRLYEGCFTNLRRGRWTATLSDSRDAEAANNGSDGIVIFLLGARLNHGDSLTGHSPMQKLAPGAAESNDAFNDMWREAEANRDKWGYLGRPNNLIDTSDGESNPMITISYWKDLKGLHEFAKTPVHRVGQNGHAANKYPYMGLMHETFYAPKGCWETIYHDFPPWGLGAAKELVEGESGLPELKDILRPAPKRSSMFKRMGRKSGVE